MHSGDFLRCKKSFGSGQNLEQGQAHTGALPADGQLVKEEKKGARPDTRRTSLLFLGVELQFVERPPNHKVLDSGPQQQGRAVPLSS